MKSIVRLQDMSEEEDPKMTSDDLSESALISSPKQQDAEDMLVKNGSMDVDTNGAATTTTNGVESPSIDEAASSSSASGGGDDDFMSAIEEQLDSIQEEEGTKNEGEQICGFILKELFREAIKLSEEKPKKPDFEEALERLNTIAQTNRRLLDDEHHSAKDKGSNGKFLMIGADGG
jgi:hypothetical protein